ncbi:RNA polymerase sigma-54 factor [Amorphus orientalis]|uniref:RNA polymerase sigma-54 factor n=2 Tax=Amorphus orientalis TaxID=649198 RepID=A0AAE3VMD4_9HYPH|nr:RNA polymerase sigma-54 factor [Amorphus orientalis]
MTPQLMQAIKLLQLTNLELSAVIDREIEENPLLERAGSDADDTWENEPDTSPETAPAEADLSRIGEQAVADLDAPASALDPDRTGPVDGVSEAFASDPWRSVGAGGSRPDGDMEPIDWRPPTLRDHLLEQIGLSIPEGRERLVAEFLVDCLDPTGYLRDDPAELARRLGLEPAELEAVIEQCRRLDPIGVFARDLADCLALQLADSDRLDDAMRTLLENLHLVGRRDFAALERTCGVSGDRLARMLADLKGLDPRPGLQFDVEPVRAIVPDVLVTPDPEGGFRVELNSDTLPKVLVNRGIYQTAVRAARAPDDKSYLSERLQAANWLVKSLDQRATTILKVASVIVEQQRGFLEHGVSHLKPMTLKMVADVIGIHESTVSRVTANKYLACPRGLFELKSFFSAAIAASGGAEAHSAAAVRHRIRRMIDAECADTVLSDDAIVRQLKDDGVDIARRTVAKYREAMHIPSSVQRRREKQHAQRTSS